MHKDTTTSGTVDYQSKMLIFEILEYKYLVPQPSPVQVQVYLRSHFWIHVTIVLKLVQKIITKL